MANQSLEAAETTLLREIFAPVFFNKLANDYGIVPANDAEAGELLEMAEQLPQLKQAAPTTSVISQAADGIRTLTGSRPAVKQAALDAQVSDLVGRACSVPEIHQAALNLAAALTAGQ